MGTLGSQLEMNGEAGIVPEHVRGEIFWDVGMCGMCKELPVSSCLAPLLPQSFPFGWQGPHN